MENTLKMDVTHCIRLVYHFYCQSLQPGFSSKKQKEPNIRKVRKNRKNDQYGYQNYKVLVQNI